MMTRGLIKGERKGRILIAVPHAGGVAIFHAKQAHIPTEWRLGDMVEGTWDHISKARVWEAHHLNRSQEKRIKLMLRDKIDAAKVRDMR